MHMNILLEFCLLWPGLFSLFIVSENFIDPITYIFMQDQRWEATVVRRGTRATSPSTLLSAGGARVVELMTEAGPPLPRATGGRARRDETRCR
jgi:hypothetical protein